MKDPRIWILIGVSVALLVTFLALMKNQNRIPRYISRISLTILIAILLVFLIIRPFLIGIFVIPSESMTPTLQESDLIIVNKFVYKFHKPHFQDVIVFKAPEEICEEGCEEDYVKRVIGLPGDVLEIKKGILFRNYEVIGEYYVTDRYYTDMKRYRIPEGKLFVMGDNRNNSFDSREWGTLSIDRVLGQATFIVSPMKRLGYVQ